MPALWLGGYYRDGSATPMRGKSLTYRKPGFRPCVAVSDRQRKKRPHGKSKTCRASAWQSHERILSDGGFVLATLRFQPAANFALPGSCGRGRPRSQQSAAPVTTRKPPTRLLWELPSLTLGLLTPINIQSAVGVPLSLDSAGALQSGDKSPHSKKPHSKSEVQGLPK